LQYDLHHASQIRNSFDPNKRPIGESTSKRAGICLLEADVGEATKEAEDLPELATWGAKEDTEDPGGEERQHGRERERLGSRQSRARPCELRLALISGRRVVAAGACGLLCAATRSRLGASLAPPLVGSTPGSLPAPPMASSATARG